MRSLFCVHGAWSTGKSFSWLVEMMRKEHLVDDVVLFSYSIQTTTLDEIVARAYDEMKAHPSKEFVVVGHSLGGLISLSLDIHPKVSSIITVASPLYGLTINRFLKAMLSFRSPYLLDACHDSYSQFMVGLKERKYTKPVTCLVSEKGYSPFMFEQNDGVISYRSQTSWQPENANIIRVPANHHEILMSSELVEEVQKNLINGYKPKEVK